MHAGTCLARRNDENLVEGDGAQTAGPNEITQLTEHMRDRRMVKVSEHDICPVKYCLAMRRI
jgi:hypothetical protein